MLPLYHLPDMYHLIVASRSQACAIGRPGEGTHLALMMGIDVQFFAGHDTPDAHGLIAAPGGHMLAIWRPGHGIHHSFVPTQEEVLHPAGGIPDMNGGFISC